MTIKYDRRDPTMREQYNTLIDCIKCEGKLKCGRYIVVDEKVDPICGWYRTIENDIKKFETDIGIPTFPLLKKVLEDLLVIEKELPAHEKGLYVQGYTGIKT